MIRETTDGMAASDPDLDRDPVEELAEEFLRRRRHGEGASIAEYVERHPGLADRINDLFPTLLLMEELKVAAFTSHSGTARTPAMRSVGARLGSPALERLGDFRILREIGRGGMGVVYEAEQESLGRHVALKVLPPTCTASPSRLQRFLREAQAAARLHHTNIVPIFGVGEQDGVRYYVMQLIPGHGLDQILAAAAPRIGQRALPAPDATSQDAELPRRTASVSENGCDYWRGVARIGIQVADALEYAHRQGILHRDIKPANLILDEQGTTWIADFGLAKLADVDDLTHSGDTVGTLRYMAPERFSGLADARSDVYSLGLTLYELLTFRPAFDEKDRGSLIRQVTQEEPPRPRKLAPEIPRDLETIVVKAINASLELRYQTAGELADDLRCFLEDRPIRARRITLPGRMWRWCRRNRAVAALAGTALLLLITVAVVASAGYVRTNRALDRVSEERELADLARELETMAREEAEVARQQAETERTRTKAQRERAEANLRLATKAFEEIFSKVATDPLTATAIPADADADEDDDWPEPAWETVVSGKDAAMLESMLKFYDQFAQQNQADVKLQRETARAYRRVGEIQRHLGQYAKAEVAYRHALAIQERLADTAPESAELLTPIAALHNELGLVLRGMGKFAEAAAAHRQALDTLGKVSTPAVSSAESRFELAKTHRYLGASLPFRPAARTTAPGNWRGPRASSNRAQEAEDNNRKALDILAQLTREAPENPRYRLAMAYSQRDRSWIAAANGRRDEAEQARKQAVGILEQLTVEFPNNPDYRFELAETYTTAVSLRREGRPPEGGAEQLRRAVDLGGDLMIRYPTVPQYRASLARSCIRLAEVLRSSGSLAEAEELFRKAVELEKNVAAECPSVEAYRLALARSMYRLAEIQMAQKEWSKARATLEQAVAGAQEPRRPASGSGSQQGTLAMQYTALAKVLRELGQNAQAEEALKKAAEAARHRGRPAGPRHKQAPAAGLPHASDPRGRTGGNPSGGEPETRSEHENQVGGH